MEAPEKIYLYPSDRAGEEYEEEWGDKPWGEDYIEYTRTDVIEKKIEDWFADVENGTVITDVKLFSKDLIEYLKK